VLISFVSPDSLKMLRIDETVKHAEADDEPVVETVIPFILKVEYTPNFLQAFH